MFSKRARFWLAILAMISLLALFVACTGSDDEEDNGDENGPEGVETTTKTAYKPTGNEGSITGKVSLNGNAPASQQIDMSADGACAKANPNAVAQTVVANNGNLQYTFVYIKEGQLAAGNQKIGNLNFTPPAQPVTLDQKGCQYTPHVIGIQTGQKLSVTNSDQTTHNVNVQPKNNQPFNQAQGQGAAPIVKEFSRAETLIPTKCNQHPWMKAWIGVLPHPLYAVSREDGTFEIKGVPPGTYTVVAWHERYGEKPMQVTVSDKATATADFAFDAGAALLTPQSRSLEILPALDLPMLMKH